MLCFEKQLRLFQNPLPDLRRSVAPCGVELTGLPAHEAMPRKGIRHPLAILDVGARHRHQILHRDMSRDLAHADFLLDHLGKKFNQSQSAGYPARAAIESARQIIQAVAKTLLEFGKQPPLLQRRVAFAEPHRTFQHQSLGFTHGPDHRLDRVAA